jgi:hypothetical protein
MAQILFEIVSPNQIYNGRSYRPATASGGSGRSHEICIYYGRFYSVLAFRILRYVLYCTVLYCTVLYCTVLYCTVLYCTVLYCTVLYCTVLYCTVVGLGTTDNGGYRNNSKMTKEEEEERNVTMGTIPQIKNAGRRMLCRMPAIHILTAPHKIDDIQ